MMNSTAMMATMIQNQTHPYDWVGTAPGVVVGAVTCASVHASTFDMLPPCLPSVVHVICQCAMDSASARLTSRLAPGYTQIRGAIRGTHDHRARRLQSEPRLP